MDKNLEDKNLARRVKLYIQRAGVGDDIEHHPLDEVGYWRIISGCYGGQFSEPGWQKPLKDIVYGKFIDAVAYAVQQKEFYGRFQWGGKPAISPGNCNAGKVEKINVIKLKAERGLAQIVRDYPLKALETGEREKEWERYQEL